MTDHQAHAWVEAWFDGFGWLAFDPTPVEARSRPSTRSPRTRPTPWRAGHGALPRLHAVVRLRSGSGVARRRRSRADDRGRRSRGGCSSSRSCRSSPRVRSSRGKSGAPRTTASQARPAALASGVRAELVAALLDRGAPVAVGATTTTSGATTERVLARPPARSPTRSPRPASGRPAARRSRRRRDAPTELARVISRLRARRGRDAVLRGFVRCARCAALTRSAR